MSVLERAGRPDVLPVRGPAALKWKDRGTWIGWGPAQRGERLKWIVQNRRMLNRAGKEPCWRPTAW